MAMPVKKIYSVLRENSRKKTKKLLNKCFKRISIEITLSTTPVISAWKGGD
jgi:hypothetical protein